MTDRQTLVVFGIGRLGGAVVDVLAANYPQHRYVFVSRSRERAAMRANLTRYICAQWGQFPEVSHDATDLMNVDATADLLARHKPDIVFNATTPFPWWAMDAFPPNIRQLTYGAGLGMWCALDVVLPLRLSESLAHAPHEAVHVNGCYPDMVNAFLRNVPARPTMGIGNASNLIPGLVLTFGDMLSVEPGAIAVRLVAHHYTGLNAPTLGGCGGAPYHLSVFHNGDALTFTAPDDTPFAELKARFTRVRGVEGQGVTVSSAATVLATLLQRDRRRHHMPGPNGLPGGYPVILTEDGRVELDLPDGLDQATAVAINEGAQTYDGLATVGPGEVSLTPAAHDALAEIVGIELPVVTQSNAQEVAVEVLAGLNDRYGFELSL